QSMGDGFRHRKRIWDHAAVEITRGANSETCRLVQQHRIVRHEVKRAGIAACRIVTSAKIISVDPRDSLGGQVEYDLVMRLHWSPEPREVDEDVAACHGSSPFMCAPRGPLRGASQIAPQLDRQYRRVSSLHH